MGIVEWWSMTVACFRAMPVIQKPWSSRKGRPPRAAGFPAAFFVRATTPLLPRMVTRPSVGMLAQEDRESMVWACRMGYKRSGLPAWEACRSCRGVSPGFFIVTVSPEDAGRTTWLTPAMRPAHPVFSVMPITPSCSLSYIRSTRCSVFENCQSCNS